MQLCDHLKKIYSRKFTHFNPIQTQIFESLYHNNYNVLIAAPTGSGKTQQNRGRSSSRGGGDWYSKRGNNSGTASGNYSPRSNDSYGYWKNGKHHRGTSNPRLEKELFGLAEDSDRQSTGIKFDKYDDIPVETSGTDVPAAINTVSIILFTTVDYFNLFVFFYSLLNSQLTMNPESSPIVLGCALVSFMVVLISVFNFVN